MGTYEPVRSECKNVCVHFAGWGRGADGICLHEILKEI